jgi:hypothetical protein
MRQLRRQYYRTNCTVYLHDGATGGEPAQLAVSTSFTGATLEEDKATDKRSRWRH